MATPTPTDSSKPWSPEAVLKDMAFPHQSGKESPIAFFHILERLKTTKREGWRRFGITGGESISDHMYRMSIMTLLGSPTLNARLDIGRCTQMALIHDMAESLVGDITPVDGVSKQEKSRREAATMDLLCDGFLGRVHNGANGEHIKSLWREYEDDVTEEAHFVHDIDKIELLLQMLEYERQSQGKIDLGEFTWVSKRVKLPEMRSWADEILQDREQFWASIGKASGASRSLPGDLKAAHDEYYGQTTQTEKPTT